MATLPQKKKKPKKIDYPTSDGRPVAETDWHREIMFTVIATLQAFFAGNPLVYVSGNLLVFYEEGNRRKHVSPDVFVVRGIPKRKRKYYLIWEEGKSPEVVIELTSSSTRREDQKKKFDLYRDVLHVQEYFLFDPFEEYLKPSLQGYRLHDGQYVPIEPVAGRMPSEVLGLHLERQGTDLRLYDPAIGRWLPTPEEARLQAEAEVERLREEVEKLRKQK